MQEDLWGEFCETEPLYFVRKTLREYPILQNDPQEIKRLSVTWVARKTRFVPEPKRQAIMREFVKNVCEMEGIRCQIRAS